MTPGKGLTRTPGSDCAWGGGHSGHLSKGFFLVSSGQSKRMIFFLRCKQRQNFDQKQNKKKFFKILFAKGPAKPIAFPVTGDDSEHRPCVVALTMVGGGGVVSVLGGRAVLSLRHTS